MDNANVKLSLKEKLSYGASDCAYNLVFNVVTTYMMFYYTDVAGISLLSVGTLFLVVRVLDAIAGPVVVRLLIKRIPSGARCVHGSYGSVPICHHRCR